jgi:hypothetical protein
LKEWLCIGSYSADEPGDQQRIDQIRPCRARKG